MTRLPIEFKTRNFNRINLSVTTPMVSVSEASKFEREIRRFKVQRGILTLRIRHEPSWKWKVSQEDLFAYFAPSHVPSRVYSAAYSCSTSKVRCNGALVAFLLHAEQDFGEILSAALRTRKLLWLGSNMQGDDILRSVLLKVHLYFILSKSSRLHWNFIYVRHKCFAAILQHARRIGRQQ